MASASADQVFSIPFRYLWNSRISGELLDQADRPSGLARFVGDEQNKVLRIFSVDDDEFLSPANRHLWPLVLSGPSGTGKTSLALTIISDISEKISSSESDQRFPNLPEKPVVLTALDFDRRFRAALETDSVRDFRKRLLLASGVVIDDVQKISNKEAAQNELLQLIDRMLLRDRPIVLTIDRDPSLTDGLIPQLTSRLSGGLSLPVHAPGRDARAVIISDLCQIYHLELTEAAQKALVDRLSVTVPKLIHFFNQLQTHLRADKKSNPAESVRSFDRVDVACINQVLKRSDCDLERLSKAISSLVASEFQVRLSDLRGDSRKQTIVLVRAVAIYLNRNLLGLSFSKIGNLFGNRDHSTVMHAYRKIESIMSPDAHDRTPSAAPTRNKIENIERELLNQFAGQIDL